MKSLFKNEEFMNRVLILMLIIKRNVSVINTIPVKSSRTPQSLSWSTGIFLSDHVSDGNIKLYTNVLSASLNRYSRIFPDYTHHNL